MVQVIIYTDGGARNNPGPAAAGAVIIQGGKTIAEIKQYLGAQTNNWAEYEAVALVLTEAKRLGLGGQGIEVRLDSKLVAEQLMGNWKIKEPTLKPQWAKVRAMMAADFPGIIFTHIPREKNKQADRLVNEALDEAGH
ncbi:ribonuclease HI family protein [Candidatus Kaiserbacteria bacterium]|nr:ribonuclease HI family protein [Candidatus Kaiserbacteria bacterium]